MVSEELLLILVCPKCKSQVLLHQELCCLVCHACQCSYQIKGGIPSLLVNEATPFHSKGDANNA